MAGKQTFPGNYPAEMRRQLWPLCCGASILSGFKQVNVMSDEELVKQIEKLCSPGGPVPDFQVFTGEHMTPKFTFLTLNSGQAQSPKITNAIAKAGFFLVGTGKPRGSLQYFYLRDDSNDGKGSWEPTSNTKACLKTKTAIKEAAKAAA